MTGGAVVAVAAAAGGLWLLLRKPKKSAPPCPLTPEKIHEWGVQYGRTGFYIFTMDTVPKLDDLLATYPVFQTVPVNTLFIVTKSGNFWRYDAQGVAHAAPELRASYCAWVNK